MYDMLPFLRITGNTPEKQITEITEYLTQFKETLEFILSNISLENLSPELVRRLEVLDNTIAQINSNREEEIAQISRKMSSES